MSTTALPTVVFDFAGVVFCWQPLALLQRVIPQHAVDEASARLWAQQVTVDEAQRRSLQDVRAPGQWRANAPLTQQPAFGAAFACKQGTPMQPRKPEEMIRIFP